MKRRFLFREKVTPGMFSSYHKFFKDAKWELFAVPYKCGSEFNYRIRGTNAAVLPVPAVYEFAVCKSPKRGTRHVVYIGNTTNMRSRREHYVDENNQLTQTNHIAELMHTALESGLFIYRRVRYISSYARLSYITRAKQEFLSVLWTNRLLSMYNYAWNANNTQTREIRSGQVFDHTNRTRAVKKVPFMIFFSRVQFS